MVLPRPHKKRKKEEKEKKNGKKIKMHRGVGCNPDNVFDIAIYMALKRKRGEEKSRCICRHLRIVHKKEKPISWRHFIASSIHEHRKLRRFPPSFFFFLFLSASQNVKM